MKNMKKNFQYTYKEVEEVEDIIIDIALDTMVFQEEDTIKDYKITYKDYCEIENISIIKKKDKYIIDVNGATGELKIDENECYRLMLKKKKKKILSRINENYVRK